MGESATNFYENHVNNVLFLLVELGIVASFCWLFVFLKLIKMGLDILFQLVSMPLNQTHLTWARRKNLHPPV